MTENSETRQFSMHKQLLFDVIQRQAGTLNKAILELVMNAVDAGATNIEITLDARQLHVRDDGRGFRSRREVEDFFEVFGQPRQEGEQQKTYGCFRMGRGQAMAFGHNVWRTGEFRMDVDIKERGLDYLLSTGLEPQAGCCVCVDLYQPLDSYDLRCANDELLASLKWVAVPVRFNGLVISRDPAVNAEFPWTDVTDAAYLRLTETGDLKVYNLGVLVREYGAYAFGCGGEVVSRVPLRLNFARNDVLSDCEIWQEVRKHIDAYADKSAKTNRRSLTDAARCRLIRMFSAGSLAAEDAVALPLFSDVNGKHWSIAKLGDKLATYRNICIAAAKGDNRACRLMDHKLAFAFDEEIQRRFGFPVGIAGLVKLLAVVKETAAKVLGKNVEAEARTSRELLGVLDATYTILPPKERTVLEKAALETADTAGGHALQAMPVDRLPRRLLIGKAGCANGWTDGVSYVAFNRDYLRKIGADQDGWLKFGQLWLHEYCHGEPDDKTHAHSPEFYELYHDCREALTIFVDKALLFYERALERHGKCLTRASLRQQKRAKLRAANLDKLAALIGGEDVIEKTA